MNIIDIINKKRKKEELTDLEIKYVVESYTNERGRMIALLKTL